jgi:hypothetical protein
MYPGDLVLTLLLNILALARSRSFRYRFAEEGHELAIAIRQISFEQYIGVTTSSVLVPRKP